MKVWMKMATVAAMLAATASADAQVQAGQQRGMGGGMNPTAALMAGITLTTEQQASVDSVQKAYEPQMAAQMQEMRTAREQGADMRELMQKRTELSAKMFADIRGVLTEEQQAVFDRNLAELQARRQQMQGQGRGGPPPR
jgi:Spy/CpxP family protein refolding chaperone